MLFLEFRNSFLQAVLDLVWGQWSVLGIPGRSNDIGDYCLDPEALVLSTSLFGRYDQRIFDGMLRWLIENENLIHINRLASLIKNESYADLRVFRMISSYLYSREKKIKWRKFADIPQPVPKPESFFLLPSGLSTQEFGSQDGFFLTHGFSRNGLEKKDLSGVFLVNHPAFLWLRLRAFMGVSTRTDVCLYLITHIEGGHPSLIARILGYAQAGIHNTLVSMSESGWIHRMERRREVIYVIDDSLREAFTSSLDHHPLWLTWPSFYKALALIWKTLNAEDLSHSSTDVQSAELRQTMLLIDPDLSRIGLSGCFVEAQNKRGAEYIDSLSRAWNAILNEFNNHRPV